jgi:hypothetical protein
MPAVDALILLHYERGVLAARLGSSRNDGGASGVVAQQR